MLACTAVPQTVGHRQAQLQERAYHGLKDEAIYRAATHSPDTVQALPGWLGALVPILAGIRLSKKIAAQHHTVELRLSQRILPRCSIRCFLNLQWSSKSQGSRRSRSDQEPWC